VPWENVQSHLIDPKNAYYLVVENNLPSLRISARNDNSGWLIKYSFVPIGGGR